MPQEPTEQTRNNFREDEGLAAQLTQVVTHTQSTRAQVTALRFPQKTIWEGHWAGGGGDTWHS